MKILALNCGGCNFRFQSINTKELAEICVGLLKKNGVVMSIIQYEFIDRTTVAP